MGLRTWISKAFGKEQPPYVFSPGIDRSLPNWNPTWRKANEGWVYICASKNSWSVSRGFLRLYAMRKGPGGAAFKTRSLKRAQREYIEDRHPEVLSRGASVGRTVVEEVVEHPFLDLMRDWNGYLNKTDGLMLTQNTIELSGNAYWFIVTDEFGRPIQLWPLPPDFVHPVQGKNTFIEHYELIVGGIKHTIPKDRIVHFKIPDPTDPSGVLGKAPYSGVDISVRIGHNMGVYENTLFQNMGVLSAFFSTSLKLNEAEYERLKKELRLNYGGTQNAGKIAVFDNDLKGYNFGSKPNDLMIDGLDKKNMTMICAAYGVPISLITVESVNRSNADAGFRAYMLDTISPRMLIIEEKINQSLLPLWDKNLFCAFDNPAKEDNETTMKILTQYKATGILTPNEVREEIYYPPIEGGDTLQETKVPQEPNGSHNEPQKPPAE